MKEELCKVGVIGVGYLGQHHARLYGQLPMATLVGIVDSNFDRAVEISDKFGGQPFDRIQDLLPYVEAVSVAVPTSAHFSVVSTCLEAGIHVLVEKPITVTSQEGRELDRLAKNNGLILQVGHIERFNPVWEGIRSSISNPYFLEAQRLSPFPHRGTDVDVVRDLMVHDIDILLSLNLGTLQSIEAVGMALVSPFIDYAHARIQWSGGCQAVLTASRISVNRVRSLSLLHENSMIHIDYQTRRSVMQYRSGPSAQSVETQMVETQGSDHEPLKLQLESFLDSVRHQTKPLVSGEEGSLCLEIAEDVLGVMQVRHMATPFPFVPPGPSGHFS